MSRPSYPVMPLVMLVLVPPAGLSQSSAPGPSVSQPQVTGKQDFHVQGRVTTITDEPIGGAEVQVDIGVGPNPVRTLETNLKGEFETDYSLDPVLMRRRGINALAMKAGYVEAFETADFASLGSSWTVSLVMHEEREQPDQLPLAQVISILGRRCLVAPPGSAAAGQHSPPTEKAARSLDRRDYAAAVSALAAAVDREPDCARCRTLLGLALLGRGSWSSAMRQIDRARELGAAAAEGRRPSEPLLVLGVIEDWRQNPKQAAGLFHQALELDPQDGFALEELGRTLILETNWPEADKELAKAIKAGAPADAHLLRARALLSEGVAKEAESEMNAYLGGRNAKDLPDTVRAQWAQMVARLEIESSARPKSVVERPLSEVTHDFPGLQGLEPAAGQDELAEILRKVAANVEAFFRDFPNTNSLEQIREEHLQRQGKVTTSLDQEFQYLCLAPPQKSGLAFVEYRTQPSGSDPSNPRGLESGFMLTGGFASAPLPFHPLYQPDSAFRYLGRQSVDGRPTLVVAFAQRPELARLTGSFRMNQTSVTTLTQGLAWIDADTYQIVQMHTDLLYPLPQVQLQRESTAIQFERVQFKETAEDLWLPRDVTVTVEWRGKTLRNRHRYSGFKFFDVQTTQRLLPQQPRREADASTGGSGDQQ